MRSNYKRLGDYIEPSVEKNTGNLIKELRGISNQKFFQKAKTNTIGVDLSKYRVVRTRQFAFNRATTRNGDKISIALREEEDCIVSPSYRMFRSKDENVLNSEYLMMWFRRPEFDRYARFKSHGSAHEFFDLDEMYDVQFPLPSIEKQRAIVKEYNTIVNRIKLNEELNQKLEETAQALYKNWFVDFEFPNENGKPYKSSGGKLVYNEELDKDVPEGWDVCKLENYVDLSFGGDWGKEKPEANYLEKVTCVRGADIQMFKSGSLINAPIRYILNKNLKNKEVRENNIIIEISGGSPTQSTGRVVLVSVSHIQSIEVPIICSNFCRVIKLNDNLYSRLLYNHINYLYNLEYLFTFENSTTGVKNFNFGLPTKNWTLKEVMLLFCLVDFCIS
jgi:type I restriction enzyme, S subunit